FLFVPRAHKGRSHPRTRRELNVFSAHVTGTIVKTECCIEAPTRSGIGTEDSLACHSVDQIVPAAPVSRRVRKCSSVINAAKFVNAGIGLASPRGRCCLSAV